MCFLLTLIDGNNATHQVDFPEVVKRKASLILQHKELSEALGTVTSESEQWLGGGISSLF